MKYFSAGTIELAHFLAKFLIDVEYEGRRESRKDQFKFGDLKINNYQEDNRKTYQVTAIIGNYSESYLDINLNNRLTLQEIQKINEYKIEPAVEKQNIQNEISPNQLNSKNNTKTQEVKSENPKFKIGQTVGLIYYDNEIHASVLTIYQVIKIENKYFYKVKDEISNIQFNKLIPEENLYEDTGG